MPIYRGHFPRASVLGGMTTFDPTHMITLDGKRIPVQLSPSTPRGVLSSGILYLYTEEEAAQDDVFPAYTYSERAGLLVGSEPPKTGDWELSCWYVATAEEPDDRYNAGYDLNLFATEEAAEEAARSLAETVGGDWVAYEEILPHPEASGV